MFSGHAKSAAGLTALGRLKRQRRTQRSQGTAEVSQRKGKDERNVRDVFAVSVETSIARGAIMWGANSWSLSAEMGMLY